MNKYQSNMKIKLLRWAEVDKLLSYDPETGVLTWKVIRGSTIRPGDPAQPVQMSLSGVRVPTNHVIWFLRTKMWPKYNIVNINNNRYDNSWKNLVHMNEEEKKATNYMRDYPESIAETPSGQFAVKIDMGGQGIIVGVYKSYDVAEKVRNACFRVRDYNPETES